MRINEVKMFTNRPTIVKRFGAMYSGVLDTSQHHQN